MKKTLFLTLMISAVSFAQMAKEMTVYKTPYCGCCENWIKAMKKEGFKIDTVVKNNLHGIKKVNGITAGTSSCHTALINGYVIEGHVDYSAIKKLLSEKPKDIRGLTVPGMVVGSPGMEMGNKKDPYNILAIKNDGSTEIYEKH